MVKLIELDNKKQIQIFLSLQELCLDKLIVSWKYLKQEMP